MKSIGVVLGTGLILASVPAFAGGYPAAPPASGSPLYSPQSVITGDASAALGYFWWNDDAGKKFDSQTGEVWGTARLNVPFWNGWNEEIELSGLDGFKKDSYYAYGAYSHTYWKNPQFAAGLLIGGSSLDGSGAATVGAEAAVFMPSTTLVGLLGYSWADDIPDFWTAAGEARWYWNANTRLTGMVAYNSFNTAWAFTAEAEHRFDGTMFSLFADGTYYNNDAGTGWEVFGGGRVFLDRPGQTLQGHDHDVPFAAARAITF